MGCLGCRRRCGRVPAHTGRLHALFDPVMAPGRDARLRRGTGSGGLALVSVELFVEHLGQIINLSQTGQIEMAELISAYLERVERDAKGLPIKLYPFMRTQPPKEQPRTVVIDPEVSFGRPVLAGTGIPTAALAEQFKAGDRVPDLAKDYGASEEAVWDAIRCELKAA